MQTTYIFLQKFINNTVTYVLKFINRGLHEIA